MNQEKKICGIIIPISEIDGCSETHWIEVLGIITQAVEDAGFEANIVSNADDVGIIQKRIIQNLYDNPIVVCDVSGKNPNVMFELGIRLAFDKPTIIVKDEKTAYSFDTASIEHLEYPRDLRFSKIIEFKRKLTEKVQATYQKALGDPNYTTFLKHFGEFTVAKIDKKEVTEQQYLLEELKMIRSSIARMERYNPIRQRNLSQFTDPGVFIDISAPELPRELLPTILNKLDRHPGIANAAYHRSTEGNNFRIHLHADSPSDIADIRRVVAQYTGGHDKMDTSYDSLSTEDDPAEN